MSDQPVSHVMGNFPSPSSTQRSLTAAETQTNPHSLVTHTVDRSVISTESQNEGKGISDKSPSDCELYKISQQETFPQDKDSTSLNNMSLPFVDAEKPMSSVESGDFLVKSPESNNLTDIKSKTTESGLPISDTTQECELSQNEEHSSDTHEDPNGEFCIRKEYQPPQAFNTRPDVADVDDNDMLNTSVTDVSTNNEKLTTNELSPPHPTDQSQTGIAITSDANLSDEKGNFTSDTKQSSLYQTSETGNSSHSQTNPSPIHTYSDCQTSLQSETYSAEAATKHSTIPTLKVADLESDLVAQPDIQHSITDDSIEVEVISRCRKNNDITVPNHDATSAGPQIRDRRCNNLAVSNINKNPSLIRHDSPLANTTSMQKYASVPTTPISVNDMPDDLGESAPDLPYTYGDSETCPLLHSTTTYVYFRRWYVLGVFSLTAMLQGLGWGVWGPITQSAKAAFGWSNGDIALLALWGNLSYVIFAFPISALMEKKGLRFSMIISMVLQAAGFGCRCITAQTPTVTWLMNIGQILIGGGAVVPYSAVSLFSAHWFPPSQRTTSTSISTVFGYIGLALAFIIGPLIVPEPITAGHHNGTNGSLSDASKNFTNTSELRDSIMKYMYYEAGAAAFVLLLVLIYFPSKPPRPPSLTAKIERLELGKGLKSLSRNTQFLLLLTAYSIGTGVYGAFTITIEMDVKPLGVGQKTAGWMGFFAIIGSCATGLIVSRISDIFMRRLKLVLLLMFIPATSMFVWLCLLVNKYIPNSLVSLYISVIAPGCLNVGSIPLFYELACEVAYPTGEGITTLILTLLNNLVGVIFLGVLMIPNIGVIWMNWVLIASMTIAVVLLLMVKENYYRTNIDTMEVIVASPQQATAAVPGSITS